MQSACFNSLNPCLLHHKTHQIATLFPKFYLIKWFFVPNKSSNTYSLPIKISYFTSLRHPVLLSFLKTKARMAGCVKLDVTIFFYLHFHITICYSPHSVFPCSISRKSSEASFCLIACLFFLRCTNAPKGELSSYNIHNYLQILSCDILLFIFSNLD